MTESGRRPESGRDAKRKTLKGGALVAPLLVLCALAAWQLVTVAANRGQIEVSQVVSDVAELAVPRPVHVFKLDGIEGIDAVFQAASALAPANPSPEERASLRAFVLPHHTYPAEELAVFWTDIGTRLKPSVIVVVGAAHDNQGKALVQAAKGVWITPTGSVATDDAMVDTLISSGISLSDPSVLDNEHSIGTQIPYIATVFPGVPVVPVIAQSPAGEIEARQLVADLLAVLPKDALFVSSIDFSHFLSVAEAEKRDERTLDVIANRNYAVIDGLSSEYLDSPFTLETFLIYADAVGCDPKLAWHEQSGRLSGDLEAPGTSYLVYSCSTFEPLILTAAGDVMLGRGVATWLSRTTAAEAFADAASVFSGSDIAFVNLESVLSDLPYTCGKEICLRAEPERVDVLKTIGVTHASVSNNHAEDYTEASWSDSSAWLAENGIAPVGGFRNDGETVFTDVGGRTVAFIAFQNVSRSLAAETVSRQISAAEEQSDLTVVSFHWDREYVHEPLEVTQEIAHLAVDSGADIVIGHHPHVLQGVEVYDGALVLYSLGNFVFDQEGEGRNESVVAKITLTTAGNSLELIPMQITKGFPHRLEGEEAQAVLDRMASWSGESLRAELESGIIPWK